MRSTWKLGAAAVALAVAAQPAFAANYLYMTGTSDPWGSTSNDEAMDLAFGAGNWTKYNGFDAAVFSSGASFIFFDGSDANGPDFTSFLSANMGALTAFVNGGGSVFSNIATNEGPPTADLGFGYTTTYPSLSSSASLTAAGLAAGLDANGAGAAWTGIFFGHNVNNGNCYILGDGGCVFAGGAEGLGAYFVGGMTTPDFHSAGGHQLRANELNFVAGFAANGAIPEPATWAMMIGGFGLVGAAMRRRKPSASYA